MAQPLVLPPGHRITITVDGDAELLGVTVAAYRGEEWLGEMTIGRLTSLEQLQATIDELTHRGPRLLEGKLDEE